jgi:nucleoside phosphorylase
MEGFAVLRACERARVPGIEIRGVSNYVGKREDSGWNLAIGSRACVEALDAVLDVLVGTQVTVRQSRS